MITGQQKRDRHISQTGSSEHQIARDRCSFRETMEKFSIQHSDLTWTCVSGVSNGSNC